MRKTLAMMNGAEATQHYTHLAERRWKKGDDLWSDWCDAAMSNHARKLVREAALAADRKAKLYSEADTRRDGWQAKRALRNLDQYGMAAATGFLVSCNWPIDDAADLLLNK